MAPPPLLILRMTGIRVRVPAPPTTMRSLRVPRRSQTGLRAIAVLLGMLVFQGLGLHSAPLEAPLAGPVSGQETPKTGALDLQSARSISVKDFGAAGDGLTDDTEAMNRAASWAKTRGRALAIPAGIYRMTAPWNLTGARDGFKLLGEGRTSTRIHIAPAKAAVCVEGLNSPYLHLADMSIFGLGDNCTGVILVGGAAGTGDHFYAENCHFETTSAASLGTVIVNASDLSTLRRCWIYGPASTVVFTANNDLGVRAAFGTLATSGGQMTNCEIDRSALTPASGCAISWDIGSELHVKSTYFGMAGTSSACIFIRNPSNGHLVTLDSCRVECPSSSKVDLIRFVAGSSSNGGSISGDYLLTGAVFNGPPGVSALAYHANGWFVSGKLLTGGMDLQYSEINNINGLHADLGASTYGNVIYGYDSHNEWVSGQGNIVRRFTDTTFSGPALVQKLPDADSRFRLGGPISVNTPGTSTGSDTRLTTLASLVIPARFFTPQTPKMGLKIRAWGRTAANGNVKTISLAMGETTLVSNDLSPAPNNQKWVIESMVVFGGGTHFQHSSEMRVGATPQDPGDGPVVLDPAEPITLNLYGRNGTPSAGDISALGFAVEVM